MNSLFAHLEGRHPEGCLTLYLERGPGYDFRFYDALLKDLQKQLAEDPGVLREMTRVRDLFARTRPSGQPLAIFSSTADGTFDALRLPEDVRSHAVFGDRFELNELARQVDLHPPGVIAVVEKGFVRLYSVVLEEVRELEHIEGERVVRDERPDNESGWPRQQAYETLKQAVDELMRVASPKRGYEAIYIAGPDEARSEFRKLLPKPAQDRVRAEFGVTLDTPPTDLANQLRRRLTE